MSCDLTLRNNPNVDRLIRFMDEHPWNYPRVMALIGSLDERGGFKHPQNNGFKEQGYDQKLIDELKDRLVFSLLDIGLMTLSSSETVAAQVATAARDAWQAFETIRTVAKAKETTEAEEVSQIMRESLLEQRIEMSAEQELRIQALGLIYGFIARAK